MCSIARGVGKTFLIGGGGGGGGGGDTVSNKMNLYYRTYIMDMAQTENFGGEGRGTGGTCHSPPPPPPKLLRLYIAIYCLHAQA